RLVPVARLRVRLRQTVERVRRRGVLARILPEDRDGVGGAPVAEELIAERVQLPFGELVRGVAPGAERLVRAERRSSARITGDGVEPLGDGALRQRVWPAGQDAPDRAVDLHAPTVAAVREHADRAAVVEPALDERAEPGRVA